MHLPVLEKPGFEVRHCVVQERIVVGNSVVTWKCWKAGDRWQEVHLPVLEKPGFEVRHCVVREHIVVGNSVVTFYVFYRGIGTISLNPDTSLLCWFYANVS